MPVKRRSSSRLLVVLLALPVIAAVYAAVFGRRALSAGRSLVAVVLGAGVIGSVYGELLARQAVAPARRAPVPVTVSAALALVLVTSGLPVAPTRAANSQADAVVKAALKYLGAPYVWGAEGPDTFDCSGLIYRAFKDAGEGPLISGKRLTAAGYYKYFATRGLTSKRDGKRGDLVVYGGGVHIGIYLGDGKVISALSKGVSIHGLNALQNAFTTFLNVDWTPEPAMTTTRFINKVPPTAPARSTSDHNTDTSRPDATGVIATGFAFGSLNLRTEPAPGTEIIGWVGKGTTFDILAAGRSPGGALWYQVRKANGREGWIWSYWVRVIDGSVDG